MKIYYETDKWGMPKNNCPFQDGRTIAGFYCTYKCPNFIALNNDLDLVETCIIFSNNQKSVRKNCYLECSCGKKMTCIEKIKRFIYRLLN